MKTKNNVDNTLGKKRHLTMISMTIGLLPLSAFSAEVEPYITKAQAEDLLKEDKSINALWNKYLVGMEVNDINVGILLGKANFEPLRRLDGIKNSNSTPEQIKLTRKHHLNVALMNAVPRFAEEMLRRKQETIAQQRTEITNLRQSIDTRLEAVNEVRRDRLFELQLILLLSRAHTGVDYAKPDNADPEIYRNTILSTAKGRGTLPHNKEFTGRIKEGGLTHNSWIQANELVRHCICNIVSGLRLKLGEIEADITQLCALLPVEKLDNKTLRIGLTLQKALATIIAYKANTFFPPKDDVDNAVAVEIARRRK